MHSHLLLGNVLEHKAVYTRNLLLGRTHIKYRAYQVLEQKLVDLWGKSLLKDREERVRLATHCHSQGKVFHPWMDAGCKS